MRVGSTTGQRRLSSQESAGLGRGELDRRIRRGGIIHALILVAGNSTSLANGSSRIATLSAEITMMSVTSEEKGRRER